MGGSDDVKGSLAGMLGGNPLMYNDDDDLKFDISGNEMKHILYGYLGGRPACRHCSWRTDLILSGDSYR